jgi:hypothetical protein
MKLSFLIKCVCVNQQYYFSSNKRADDSIEMREMLGPVDNEETPLRVENTTPLSTPLANRKSMRRILVHQMSSLELPVDKSGLVKLHYWY